MPTSDSSSFCGHGNAGSGLPWSSTAASSLSPAEPREWAAVPGGRAERRTVASGPHEPMDGRRFRGLRTRIARCLKSPPRCFTPSDGYRETAPTNARKRATRLQSTPIGCTSPQGGGLRLRSLDARSPDPRRGECTRTRAPYRTPGPSTGARRLMLRQNSGVHRVDTVPLGTPDRDSARRDRRERARHQRVGPRHRLDRPCHHGSRRLPGSRGQ
jgi:hypothetical protein